MADQNGNPKWQKILDFIAKAGADGATDNEIEAGSGTVRSTASTRRGDLVREGWVKDSGKKRKTSTGSPATVWVMTSAGLAAWKAGETSLPDPELSEDEVLVRKSGLVRKLYRLIGEHGKMTDMEMRAALKSPGSGPRDALQVLLGAGLIRPAGRANNRGRKAQRYEQTPRRAREIAAQKEKWLARRPQGKPARAQTIAGPRLQQLKRQTEGEFSEWMQVRKRILSETVLLTRVEVMSFWDSVPDHELEWVREEVVELRDWVDNALAAIELRQHDDGLRRKIEKLRETDGRTEAEIETAKGRIAVLQSKL